MAKLLVFGGSGVAGHGVLEAGSRDERVASATALQRRPVAPSLPRVTWTEARDFADLSSHRAAFEGVDAAVFALGISQTQVGEAEYRRITLDFPLEAARRLKAASPAAALVFVSGRGADPTGKSRVLFARVKGEAETRLAEMGLARLVVARPGAIVPLVWPREPMLPERLFMPLLRRLAPLLPGFAIYSHDLGRALVNAALDDSIAGILDHATLQRLARGGPPNMIA